MLASIWADRCAVVIEAIQHVLTIELGDDFALFHAGARLYRILQYEAELAATASRRHRRLHRRHSIPEALRAIRKWNPSVEEDSLSMNWMCSKREEDDDELLEFVPGVLDERRRRAIAVNTRGRGTKCRRTAPGLQTVGGGYRRCCRRGTRGVRGPTGRSTGATAR